MKIKAIFFAICVIATATAFGQGNVEAIIKLKDGKSLDVYHFGKLNCESNQYAKTFTILRGKFYGSPTEINDFSDISQLVLSGFTDPPIASSGNQKGTITAIKKDGVKVELDDAELVMSCYGPGDKFNQIRVQILNPLTQSPVDLSVEIRSIETITFN